MPKEQELQFGPKMEAYFKSVQQMSQRHVEISVAPGNPELQQLASELEYGLNGNLEQPFMRPATARVMRDVQRLLREGGPEAVASRVEQELVQFINNNVDDAEIALELKSSLRVRVIG